MSWTDKQAVRNIKYLKEKYKVNEFIETGTFKGINAKLMSKFFKIVITVEKEYEYYKIAKERLKARKNVICFLKDSAQFLKEQKLTNHTIIYLDAHFYDSTRKNKFVVIDELKALSKIKGKNKSILIIHDFDNNLGHITYDGQPLNLKLIKNDLKKVNSKFHFYTNELSSCDIVKLDKLDINMSGLDFDKDTINNLQYLWLSPRLTYRGILYCLPTKLSKKEMNLMGLKEWN